MNSSTLSSMTPALRPGDRLGNFEVQEQLASGGMGIVWKAYDRLLDRKLAIKQVASAGMVDEVQREKFRLQAELFKRVSRSHPNLVQVLDFADEPRGLFIVMEFADGASMDRVIVENARPFGVKKALSVLVEVAQSLKAIHAAGVVHRDLKPGNIMMSNSGPCRVLDFGLASLIEEQEPLSMGTAQYMAPELFGDGTVDGRADLYALGMILYQIMAGREGYDSVFKAVMRDQRHQAMRWMKWHTNPRITAPPLHTLNAQVPEVLSELIGRLMAKDPAQRIASADQLLQTVQRHFSGPQALVPGAANPATATPADAEAAKAGSATPSSVHALDQTGPATAPLPKTGKKWLIIGLSAASLVLSAGGYGLFQQQTTARDQRVLVDGAKSEYQKALKQFEENNFETAAGAFDQVAEKYADKTLLASLVNQSRGYSMLAASILEMKEADELLAGFKFEESLAIYRKSNDRLADANKLPIPTESGGLPLINLISGKQNEIEKRRLPFLASAKEVADLLSADHLDEARRKYAVLVHNRESGVLIPSEQKALGHLESQISTKLDSKVIGGILDQIESLRTSGQKSKARLDLERAIQDYPESLRLKELHARLIQELALETAQGQVANAKDLALRLKSLEDLYKLSPSEQVQKQIAETKAQIYYQEALKSYQAGAREASLAKAAESLNLNRSAEAEQLIARIRLETEAIDLVRRADASVAAGQFEPALKLYQEAMSKAIDPALSDQLGAAIKQRATRVRLHVQRAEAMGIEADKAGEDLAAANQRLQTALGELDEALGLEQTDPRALVLQRQYQLQRQFNGLMLEGQGHYRNEQYSKAKQPLKDAIDLAEKSGFDSASARKLSLDTDYWHLIQQVDRSIELRLWTQAEGQIAQAESKMAKDTDPQTRQLKRQALTKRQDAVRNKQPLVP